MSLKTGISNTLEFGAGQRFILDRISELRRRNASLRAALFVEINDSFEYRPSHTLLQIEGSSIGTDGWIADISLRVLRIQTRFLSL